MVFFLIHVPNLFLAVYMLQAQGRAIFHNSGPNVYLGGAPSFCH